MEQSEIGAHYMVAMPEVGDTTPDVEYLFGVLYITAISENFVNVYLFCM